MSGSRSEVETPPKGTTRLRLVVWLLSSVRIALLIPLLAALHRDDDTLALGLLGLAMSSDLLDGALARHWGVASDGGALVDASADATFMLSALWALADQGRATHAPLLLSLACFVHFVGSPRGAVRYDVVGRHLGTVLYVAIALLVAGGDAWVAPVMVVVALHASITLVRRLYGGAAEAPKVG